MHLCSRMTIGSGIEEVLSYLGTFPPTVFHSTSKQQISRSRVQRVHPHMPTMSGRSTSGLIKQTLLAPIAKHHEVFDELAGVLVSCTRYGRSRMTFDPSRIPTIPARSMSGFHRQGRFCLHRARIPVRNLASRMESELHPAKTACEADFLHLDDSVTLIDDG